MEKTPSQNSVSEIIILEKNLQKVIPVDSNEAVPKILLLYNIDEKFTSEPRIL